MTMIWRKNVLFFVKFRKFNLFGFQATNVDNNIRPLNADGFDIGFTRDRQSDVNDLDDPINDPANCEALGLESTFEKVLDFTYERGSKEEINLDRDIGLITSCLEICERRKGNF